MPHCFLRLRITAVGPRSTPRPKKRGLSTTVELWKEYCCEWLNAKVKEEALQEIGRTALAHGEPFLHARRKQIHRRGGRATVFRETTWNHVN